MRILYIEDERELSSAVCAGLRKCSYAVDAVFDGHEALDYYHTYEYDVIVLDLNLPDIDGLDVLRQIRQGDYKTKILILSARSAVDDRVKGLDMSANDYLTRAKKSTCNNHHKCTGGKVRAVVCRRIFAYFRCD